MLSPLSFLHYTIRKLTPISIAKEATTNFAVASFNLTALFNIDVSQIKQVT